MTLANIAMERKGIRCIAIIMIKIGQFKKYKCMAKAKDLLRSAFMFRKGIKYQPIVKQITQGEINPRATYIQTFDRMVFNLVVPDVVFITLADETCYLYKVD